MTRARWLSFAMVAMLVLLAGCKKELLTDLTQQQANQVIALLLQHNVTANKIALGKKHYRVDVAEDNFADAVDLLATYRVPNRGDLNIADLFPSDSFVNTPNAERARLLSGIEQRLEQTIGSIAGVLSARVHISYPLDEKSMAKTPLRMAVMLVRDGDTTEELLVERIKRLVRNSSPALDYDNISVVLFDHPRQRGTP